MRAERVRTAAQPDSRRTLSLVSAVLLMLGFVASVGGNVVVLVGAQSGDQPASWNLGAVVFVAGLVLMSCLPYVLTLLFLRGEVLRLVVSLVMAAITVFYTSGAIWSQESTGPLSLLVPPVVNSAIFVGCLLVDAFARYNAQLRMGGARHA